MVEDDWATWPLPYRRIDKLLGHPTVREGSCGSTHLIHIPSSPSTSFCSVARFYLRSLRSESQRTAYESSTQWTAIFISRAVDGRIPPFEAQPAHLSTHGDAVGKLRLIKRKIVKVIACYVDDARNRFRFIRMKCIVRHVNHQSIRIQVHNIVQHEVYDVCAN